MLREHRGAQFDEKGHRYIDTIMKSAKKMERLIDDLLAFSRTAKIEMRIRPVSIDSTVREVIQELQPEVEGRQIAWTIGHLPEVRGDAALLRQVWANLIGNAVKYTQTRARAEIDIGLLSEGKRISSLFGTTAPVLTRNTPASSLAFSSGCTARTSSRGPASGWRTSAESSTAMAAGPGPRERSIKGPFFIFRCRRICLMNREKRACAWNYTPNPSF